PGDSHGTTTGMPATSGGSGGSGGSTGDDAGTSTTEGVDSTAGEETGPGDEGLVWPNEQSFANSDPWIPQHHDEITQMRPRVLALNYVNARSMEQMEAQLQEMRDIIAESSRWHGYADPEAPAFLEYELAYLVDLRDETPPPGWTYDNSTLYPREDPVDGYWGFDYERLFDADYAPLLGIEDPGDPGTPLALCDA